MAPKMKKTDAEWKKELTPEQYHITREKGTEAPFTGKFYLLEDEGMYVCSNCGQKLFSSETKYHSGSGWPSFYAPVDQEAIETANDTSHGMVRDEIMCSNCGAHLGHIFNDGPNPTGLRYCVNSASLEFKKHD